MRELLKRAGAALAVPMAVLLNGCDEPMNSAGTGGNVAAPTASPAEEGPKLRPVIGQKTQDVLNYQEEMKSHPGEAQVSDLKIKAKDPITLQGNAYVTAIGKISVDQIAYALRLFEASEGRYPADYEEFMQRIIRENNIALPQLPGYQEYAYDEQTHQLVVLEYPDRKEALKAQVRGEGRP